VALPSTNKIAPADFGPGRCPLWVISVGDNWGDPAAYARFTSKSGQSSRALGMSALCQKPTYAAHQIGTGLRSISCRLWLGAGASGQPHREYRAFARLAPHRHVAAHHARKLARDRKAEPRPAVAARGQGIGLRWSGGYGGAAVVATRRRYTIR